MSFSEFDYRVEENRMIVTKALYPESGVCDICCVIPKSAFVEAYEKWIKNGENCEHLVIKDVVGKDIRTDN